MSHPSEALLAQLAQVADDLQEVVAERGYRVDLALETDEAFGSGQSRSWLMRDLIMEGIAEAASRTGISFGAVNGSGRELQVFDDEVDRHFRCKSATRDSSGQIQMMASSDAPLSVEDDDSLYPVEAWVFSWIASGSAQLDEVFIARILKFVEGNPGHLELGSPIPLLGTSPHPGGGGFKPTSEGLEGFDDDSSSADDVDTA